VLLYRIKRRAQKTALWLRGLFAWYVGLPWYQWLHKPIADLNWFERRISSQNWEDGIIHAIIGIIGTTNRYCVEFGAGEYESCTLHLLKHQGWTGLRMDGEEQSSTSDIEREFITAENIESLFQKHTVPKEFDLLVIDIDGNDYWIWKAIEHYTPRAIVIEYNACIPYAPAVTIPYQPDFAWDKTDYYGASLSALVTLGRMKGYTLVATDSRGVNAFFVKSDLAEKHFIIRPPEKIYRPAMFKGRPGGHSPDLQKRSWQTVSG
jgi:hypothetical protein